MILWQDDQIRWNQVCLNCWSTKSSYVCLKANQIDIISIYLFSVQNEQKIVFKQLAIKNWATATKFTEWDNFSLNIS